MSEINIKAVLGESPNEVWARVGQTLSVIGGLAYISFKGFGVEFAADNPNAPLILIALGFIAMSIGMSLRKVLAKAKQAHEIQLRRADRPVQEPTAGDNAFLEAFVQQGKTMTKEEIVLLPVKYQDSRTKPQLLESIKMKSADFWVRYGAIRQDESGYTLRPTDATVITQVNQ